MSGADSDLLQGRKNRTLRALGAVKDHAELVARESLASSVPSLAKRTADAVRDCALPCDESAALVEALLAIDEAASTIRAFFAADAKTNAGAASGDAVAAENAASVAALRRRRALGTAAFCAASFVVALCFHEGGVATVAFVVCVAILYPELRAFILALRESSS